MELEQMELYEIKNMIMEMSEVGAASYAKLVTPEKDVLSQREAYRSYGEARVKRWVRQRLAHTTRSGSTVKSKIHYSRAELISIEKAEKLNNLKNR